MSITFLTIPVRSIRPKPSTDWLCEASLNGPSTKGDFHIPTGKPMTPPACRPLKAYATRVSRHRWSDPRTVNGVPWSRIAGTPPRHVDNTKRPLNRGRERLSPSPPSEPGVQFSRDGLSSQLFPHRDWRANRWASDIVKSPRSAKKAFGHCL